MVSGWAIQDGLKIHLVNPHNCQEYSKCYNFSFSAYVIQVLNFCHFFKFALCIWKICWCKYKFKTRSSSLEPCACWHHNRTVQYFWNDKPDVGGCSRLCTRSCSRSKQFWWTINRYSSISCAIDSLYQLIVRISSYLTCTSAMYMTSTDVINCPVISYLLDSNGLRLHLLHIKYGLLHI